MYMPTNNSNAPIISTGDLYILRCFRGLNIPCIYAASGQKDEGFRSRYSSENWVVPDSTSAPDTFIDYLIKKGEKYKTVRPVLFFGGDTMLMLVSRNRDRLEKYYRFLLPSTDMVEDLLDKDRFYDVAINNNLTVPRTIKSSELITNEDIVNKLFFPCVIKPNLREGPSQNLSWFQTDIIKSQYYGAGKVIIIRSLEDYLDIIDEVKKYSDGFIVQEYIHGKDDQIYSFHSYVNKSGELLGYYVGRKVRTLPRLTGASTCLRLENNEHIVDEGKIILNKLGLVGVSKMDFKIDKDNDKCYLMEINTRFNLWNYLGAECGVNLPLIAYKDLLGIDVEKQYTWKTDIKWIDYEADFKAYLYEYRPAKELNLWSWLMSIKGKSVHPYLCWLDPIPGLIVGKKLLNRILKKLYRVCFK